MNEAILADRIRRALGRAAIATGAWCDVYRPDGPFKPLDPERRYLRLNATFSAAAGPQVPFGYGQATCHGLFDAAYTQPGDYLARTPSDSGDPDVWFIASQQPLAPPLCVRANRLIDLARPAAPKQPGMNGYGGVTHRDAIVLASAWPASILASGGSGLDAAGLPADAAPGAWSILLPRIAGVVLRPGDLVTDDLARTAVIATAELSALGWRLLAKQATT